MINPILASSSKRRMRSLRTPMLLTLYSIFLMIISLDSLATLCHPTITINRMRLGIDAYIYLGALQFMLILLIAPALTAGTIAGERERQTLDLLLCTRVSPLRIVLGKLLSNAGFFLLLIFSSLPAMSVVFLYGGITLAMVAELILLLMVTALAALSIGLFCSALFKRTVTATVVAYLILFTLGIGTVAFPLIFQNYQLRTLVNTVQSSAYASSYYVSSYSYSYVGSVSDVAYTTHILPLLLYLNPAVSLAALLVEQTGLLRSTLNGVMYGTYDILATMGSIVPINMAVMTGLSTALTLGSALLLRPRIPRLRKK